MTSLETYLDSKTHLIWDWNGTLLDDVELCVEIISGMLVEEGLNPIDTKEYRSTFGFPIVDYYQRIGFNFDSTSFEELSVRFISRYDHRIRECSLHQGVLDFIKQNHTKGISQSILSAAKEPELKSLLVHYDIFHFFEHVYALDNHYAASKIERGHQLIEALGASPKGMLMVGDTDHDVEVANALGIDLVLLGDGHQHAERLKKVHHQVLDSRSLKH